MQQQHQIRKYTKILGLTPCIFPMAPRYVPNYIKSLIWRPYNIKILAHIRTRQFYAPITAICQMVVFFLLLLPAKGTSIWYCKFGPPYICGSNIVFSSVNADQVICINRLGQLRWEHTYSNKVHLCQKDASTLYLQVADRVYSIASETGRHKHLYNANSIHDLVHYDFSNNYAYSTDRRFVERMFKCIDPVTGSIKWKNADIEKYLLSTPTAVVCLHAHRTIRGYTNQVGRVTHGIQYSSAEIWGLDPNTGTLIWKIELSMSHRVSWVNCARVSHYVVALNDPSRIICFNPANGQIVADRTYASDDDYDNSIHHLSTIDNQAVYMTCQRNYDRVRDGKYTLHYLSVPSMTETHTLEFSISEAAEFKCYNDFIFTTSVYRSACFKKTTGELVWNKFQLSESIPWGNEVAFSDYDQSSKLTRIGLIDIPTGETTILYSDKLPEKITLYDSE